MMGIAGTLDRSLILGMMQGGRGDSGDVGAEVFCDLHALGSVPFEMPWLFSSPPVDAIREAIRRPSTDLAARQGVADAGASAIRRRSSNSSTRFIFSSSLPRSQPCRGRWEIRQSAGAAAVAIDRAER
jgi:hypothetical protein